MRWLRINIYIGATLLTIFYWSFAISAFVFDTRKSGETWAELALSQRFADQNKISVWFTTGGMIADVWLLVLPLVATYKLQLHKTSRVALTVMFSTGALSVIPIRDGRSLMHFHRAVAASAAGVYYRHVLVHAEDETWHVLNVNLLKWVMSSFRSSARSTYQYQSLVEIDVGLITACMPSFAKMLHHHLPPWPTLKRRLKSLALACARKGTSQNVTTAPKDFEQTYKSGRDLHLEEIPHKPDLKSGDPELESLGSVQHYIGRATPEMFDDDRVLLKA